MTFEDSLGLQSAHPLAPEYPPASAHPLAPDTRTDQVRGRLDAVLVAARVAPLTRAIGLVPTVVATHTEPFHISKAIATLDHVSAGRAGLLLQISARHDEAAHFGRRTFPRPNPENARDAENAEYAENAGDTRRTEGTGQPPAPAGPDLIAELSDEAADHAEVVRRLWDSWEDDAEIRDVATGRFIDRDKLHYIDFEGRHFNVKGPSITPRPPQGQPVISLLAHRDVPYSLVGRTADIACVTPHDTGQVRAAVAEIRAAQAAAGRADERLPVLGDLVVFLDDDHAAATDRRARLDGLAGHPWTSDAAIFTGTPADLADLLLEWRPSGLGGFRLRPGVLGHDLEQITRGLVPELQRRGAFRHAYAADTLRGHLGLPRPANRYATARSGGPRSGGPRSGGPRSGGPRSGGPRSGGTWPGGPRSGEARPGGAVRP
ncbi:FMNH2-utilizing oxygenase [Streptomyces clavuligerus]|nr:FMNH2-utilizing oxygenase [Streptomyces clavuligerus]